jgi:hypothetical protein
MECRHGRWLIAAMTASGPGCVKTCVFKKWRELFSALWLRGQCWAPPAPLSDPPRPRRRPGPQPPPDCRHPIPTLAAHPAQARQPVRSASDRRIDQAPEPQGLLRSPPLIYGCASRGRGTPRGRGRGAGGRWGAEWPGPRVAGSAATAGPRNKHRECPHVLPLSDFPAENPQTTALPKSQDAGR